MHIEIDGKATGPLAGVRVLDVSTIVSGPMCAMILGDLGADVIKVEAPTGDSARWLGAEGPTGMSGLYTQLNRNKRSIVLDFKSDGGRAAYLKLAQNAEVVVENYRAGVADRLGVGYEALARENPGIVYVAISGYGPEGPYADQPAYDMVIQGLAGFAKILGTDEEPKLISNLVADKTTGLTVGGLEQNPEPRQTGSLESSGRDGIATACRTSFIRCRTSKRSCLPSVKFSRVSGYRFSGAPRSVFWV